LKIQIFWSYVISLQFANITFRHLNSEPLKLDWDSCAVVLLDEDKQFLNDQPDYEKAVSKMNHLSEVASICMHMKHKSAHSSARITAIAEQQGAAVKKKIFKHAETYYTWWAV